MTPLRGNPAISFLLLAAGTILGLAATDLILPAVPTLPQALGGSAAQAQFILASFVFGHALGLLGYGTLGAHYSQRWLLTGSAAAFALVSLACAAADSVENLILWRFLQGLLAAAPAVFAPGIIKHSFDEKQAVQAYGLIGSLEALAPAFAPVIGAWLLTLGDWSLGFTVTATGALVLTTGLLVWGRHLPALPARAPNGTDARKGSYKTLLTHLPFLRHSLSHAFNLGGLLMFVFSAPAIIAGPMGGEISDFIIMQIIGIITFIIAANRAANLRAYLGGERQMWLGGVISLVGGLGLLTFALFADADPLWLACLFFPVNLGLGLRGPVVFMEAMKAAGDDGARGGALLGLFILLTAAIGTAAIAPFIRWGLAPAAFGLVVSTIAALAVLRLPRA